MAKTRKKEMSFHITNPETKIQFLNTVQKKLNNVVSVHLMVKQDRIRVIISGSHERIRYAIQLIKRIRSSIEDKAD